MKEDWLYHRGDVYCADLDPAVGSEQGGIRPVVVIQNDISLSHQEKLFRHHPGCRKNESHGCQL